MKRRLSDSEIEFIKSVLPADRALGFFDRIGIEDGTRGWYFETDSRGWYYRLGEAFYFALRPDEHQTLSDNPSVDPYFYDSFEAIERAVEFLTRPEQL